MENKSTGAAVTVQSISVKGAAPFKNPGDVEFDVKYPEGYKGPKLMPEGPVTVSKESAEQFTKLGIGKVVKADAKAEGDAATVESKAHTQLKAEEVISQINEAATAEEVDALSKDDTRKTVLAAADARKKQLNDAAKS